MSADDMANLYHVLAYAVPLAMLAALLLLRWVAIGKR